MALLVPGSFLTVLISATQSVLTRNLEYKHCCKIRKVGQFLTSVAD